MEVEIFFEDFEAEEKPEMTDYEMIECLMANCFLRYFVQQDSYYLNDMDYDDDSENLRYQEFVVDMKNFVGQPRDIQSLHKQYMTFFGLEPIEYCYEKVKDLLEGIEMRDEMMRDWIPTPMPLNKSEK